MTIFIVMRNWFFKSFDGEFHYDHPDSTVGHSFTTLANIDGNPLSVGGEVEPDISTNRTEIFDIQANIWVEVEEYPYHKKFVSVIATVFLFITCSI